MTKSPEATEVTRPRRSGEDVPSCAAAGPSAVIRASAAAESETPARRIVLCSCIVDAPPLMVSLQPSITTIERARDLHCRLMAHSFPEAEDLSRIPILSRGPMSHAGGRL